MREIAALFGLGLVLACGRVDRAIGYVAPEAQPQANNGGSPAAGGTAGDSGDSGTAGGVETTGGSMCGVATGTASPPRTPTDVKQTSPSSGCGKALPAEQVPTVPGSRTGYTEFHVSQTGATLGSDDPTHVGDRQFFVRVPSDYDNQRPYRVVYIGSGCGLLDGGNANTYPLYNETLGGTEQAVYVGVSVPNTDDNSGCYDDSTGVQSQEWEAFDLIHSFVESTYCVDNNRIYASGFSTGALLASMWSCYFGGTPSPPLDQPDAARCMSERKFSPKWAVRGAARVAGELPPNQPVPCNGPAAGLWIHDVTDQGRLLESDIEALNLALKANGCSGNYADGPKQPWTRAASIPGLAGDVCQQYTGCSDDVTTNYPLVFCTTNGLGHADQSDSAIPAFTLFFEQMNPKP